MQDSTTTRLVKKSGAITVAPGIDVSGNHVAADILFDSRVGTVPKCFRNKSLSLECLTFGIGVSVDTAISQGNASQAWRMTNLSLSGHSFSDFLPELVTRRSNHLC